MIEIILSLIIINEGEYMCVSIPIPAIIRSAVIDSLYVRRFKDLIAWTETLNHVVPVKINGRNEVLICNPEHITTHDHSHGFKSYGWRGHQDGMIFTSAGDNTHFLFRDGIVYSTFGGILVVSSPTMTEVRDQRYLITYPNKNRGFISAENCTHDDMLDEWTCQKNKLDAGPPMSADDLKIKYPWFNYINLRG